MGIAVVQDGILLIDKPAGLSSAACVARVRKLVGERRVGHAGTLDPDATGVLVVLIGKATRLSDLFLLADKEYVGELQLGIVTSTDDAAGTVLEERLVQVSAERLEQVRSQFVGKLQQVPPQVSAVKINGKRAYKKSRAGEQFSIEPRLIEIYSLDLELVGSQRVRYRVRCSKGTYVRALARDLGEQLGCGASVLSLRRVLSGSFSVDQAVELSALDLAEIERRILPWFEPFSDLPKKALDSDELQRLDQGDPQVLKRIFSELQSPVLSSGFLVFESNNEHPQGLVFRRGYGDLAQPTRIMFAARATPDSF